MPDIPADVLAAAQAICAEFDPSDTAICIAIMQERERCAVYHDDLAAEHDEVADGDEWHQKCAYMHRRAAKFIRSPS